MRYGIDFGSWYGLLTTIVGLSVVTLVMVGIRLLVMQTVQQRRERENRQINERLRTLIAAYKTLGGSFTGDLGVDPAHLRELRLRAREQPEAEAGGADALGGDLATMPTDDSSAGERRRRVRDSERARTGRGGGGGGQGGGAGLAGAGIGLGVGMSSDDPAQRP